MILYRCIPVVPFHRHSIIILILFILLAYVVGKGATITQGSYPANRGASAESTAPAAGKQGPEWR